MNLKHAAIAVVLCLGTTGVATADERGTADQAKALLDQAFAHYKAAGREKAVADFNNKDGAFVKGDLYLFCYNVDKTLTVHGVNAKLIGRTLGGMKDADGKDFTAEIFNGGMTKGSGAVDYRWSNPLTKKIEQKSSFYQKFGDEVCSVGFYK